ncbi:MAG: hypothetical protein AAGF11_15710 [Myxococcota bacterium]
MTSTFHAGTVKSDLDRDLSLPMKLALGVAQLFLSAKSNTGIYASTSDALNGVMGRFIYPIRKTGSRAFYGFSTARKHLILTSDSTSTIPSTE